MLQGSWRLWGWYSFNTDGSQEPTVVAKALESERAVYCREEGDGRRWQSKPVVVDVVLVTSTSAVLNALYRVRGKWDRKSRLCPELNH